MANSTSGGNTIAQLRKNGVDANQFVTILAGTTGIYTDTTHTDTIVAGDQLCLKTTPPATGTFTVGNITIMFESTDPDITDSRLFLANPASYDVSTVFYSVLSGLIDNTITSTTNQRIDPKAAGDFKYWAVYSSTGGRAWNERFMKNNTDDVVARLALNSNITGLIENTSDTISVDNTGNDDDVCHLHVYGGGASNPRTLNLYGISFITNTTKQSLYVSGRVQGNVLGNNTFSYINLSGHLIISGTEHDWHTLIFSDFEFSKMQIRVAQNSINSGNSVFVFRKNSADTSLSVTVGAGLTGLFTDVTDAVTVQDGDLVNYKYTISGSSGTLTPTFISILAEDTAVGGGEPGPPVECTETSKTVTNKFIEIVT